VVLIKNVAACQRTRPVYSASPKAGDPAKYRAEHECCLILYGTAVKALKAAGIANLPDVAALQAEYAKLREQKETLYADYGKLKKQVRKIRGCQEKYRQHFTATRGAGANQNRAAGSEDSRLQRICFHAVE